VRVFLGVDLGTSGLKLTLLDETGRVCGGAEAAYEVTALRPGWAETDPQVWWGAWDTARRDLGPALRDVDLAGISVTGQMHGVVLVDVRSDPVRPAVLWPDTRAGEVLDAWHRLNRETRSRLANPLVAGMSGPLLTWLGRHEPESLRRTATVLSPKDWLRSRLTGERGTERSDASATLLWDIVADGWSPTAMELAGLGPEQLPRVHDSAAVVGSWADVPVAAGGADVACALAAVAATAPAVWPRRLVVNVGSGVQVVRPGVPARPRRDPATHLFADTDGGWYEMVGVRNGGLTLAWVQRELRLSWSELVAAAASARPGSEVFLPFLTGERGHVAPVTPRVGWAGLSDSSGTAELARAAFEALGFTIRRALELLDHHAEPVVLTGGGAREPLVRQVIADCLGAPITYVPLRSASAVGAAVLAARALGRDLPLPVRTASVEPTDDDRVTGAYHRWCAAVLS